MAERYDELKTEIQSWLDNNNPNLVAAIPQFISDAESRLSRVLRCSEQECHTDTPLDPGSGVADRVPGTYSMPTDCAALRALYTDDISLWIYYWQRIPALSEANDVNWLLQKHPDLYRYQSLVSAEGWLKNDPRIPVWLSQAESILAEVMHDDQTRRYASTPILTRTVSNKPWALADKTTRQLELLPLHDLIDLRNSSCVSASNVDHGYYSIAADRIEIWPVPECTSGG